MAQPQIVHVPVEITQRPSSTAHVDFIKQAVLALLQGLGEQACQDLQMTEFDDAVLAEHVESIVVQDAPDLPQESPFQVVHDLYVFVLSDEAPSCEREDDTEVASCSEWMLPAREFQGLWSSLVYEPHVKQELLDYALSSLLFSNYGVDPNIITFNRVVLLHGPPGTGKTSMCKALAQQLAIRLSDRYSNGVLVEINSHSLFSKWFSESGKLVQKMFQHIIDLVSDEYTFVSVLIDEVESLTAARQAAMNGTEPSDAIRVVNALLTQLDRIRRYKNVLILATSNITEAIDVAFIDRADIRQYIGPPSLEARYIIFGSCLKELMRVGFISPPEALLDIKTLQLMRYNTESALTRHSFKLLDVARETAGFSGRTMRKLPFLAQALYLQGAAPVSCEQFLIALSKIAAKHSREGACMVAPSGK